MAGKRSGNSGNNRQRGGQVRIIAGAWRGRRLPVPDAEGLRPTGDRIRETLFNWLAPALPGARCLDLFAGSGALGIEALSRGAAYCDFVDASVPIARSLAGQLGVLGATDRGAVHTLSADAFLAQRPAAPYDLVFLDPPFALDCLEGTAATLSRGTWLGAAALIYVEHSSRQAPRLPERWEAIRERRAGDVCFSLYRSSAEEDG